MYESDASLVVEVLSASTGDIDKREKALAYGTLPSILMYLVVEPDMRHIEVARWSEGVISWERFGPGESLSTPFGVWDLDGIYDTVDQTTGV